ncbi:MAG TPA: extracellular solute-binding protein [Ktedonobacteraceae bacterium]|nr:extracellular solute-binding protein [Ktedonobacteraceae bacterium]
MSTQHTISQSPVSRRRFLQVSAVGGGMFLLAACGGGGSSSGPIKLTYWLPGGSAPYCTANNTIQKNFEKLHPNIQMPPVLCGTGNQDFTEVLLSHIAAGDPPDATIFWDSPVTLGVRGAALDLTAMMQNSRNSQVDKWPAGALASCQFNGKIYGLPLTAGTYAMWYNAEWFDKLGISSKREDFPKTWDQLRALSKEFVSWKGDELQTIGFPVLGTTVSDDQHTIVMWSALNGSQIYDSQNRQYTINSDQNIAMMDYFLSWLNEQYRGDINHLLRAKPAWGAYPNGTTGQPPAFQTQKQAMLLQGSWLMGDFYAWDGPSFENWNVAPLPVGPGGTQAISGDWPNWAIIPATSRHPQEAFEFLDYLSISGIRVWFSYTPDLGANKDFPHNLLPSVTVQKRGKAFTQDALDFFYAQQKVITPMWDSPIESFASDQLSTAITRIMTKTATPKQALSDAQNACQNQLNNTLSKK